MGLRSEWPWMQAGADPARQLTRTTGRNPRSNTKASQTPYVRITLS